MSEQLLLFLAGVIAGILVNWLSTALYPPIQRLYRRSLRRIGIGVLPPIPSPEWLSVGGMVIHWIVLARARYGPGQVQCYFDSRPIPLVPEFSRMLEAFAHDCKVKLDRGESGVPHNGPMYKLREFDVGYREMIEGAEVPVLRLGFSPTDYYTQAVTDLCTGNPVRERYAKATDITVKPVPEFASIAGVGVNVITKDNYLVVAERSGRSYVAGGTFMNSIGEKSPPPHRRQPRWGARSISLCFARGPRGTRNCSRLSRRGIYRFWRTSSTLPIHVNGNGADQGNERTSYSTSISCSPQRQVGKPTAMVCAVYT